MPDIFDPIALTVARRLGGGNGSGGGVTIKNQDKTITENGTYKADSGYTGLGTVSVNVPSEEPVLQEKTVTENGTVLPDVGYDGMSKVVVDVPGIVPSGTIDITENGSYDVTNFATALVEIAASGGGGIATGTIIPAEDTTSDIGITHNLGEIPKLAVVYRELKSTTGYSGENIVSGEVAFSIAVNGERKGVGYYYSGSTIQVAVAQHNMATALAGSLTTDLNGSCIHSCTKETAKLYPIKNGTKKFAGGSKYRWILMTEEVYNAL